MEDLKVCTYRPSMKYNCVLDKPDVGRQKIPLCRLPSLEFTYGYPNPKPGDRAKEALFNWYEKDKSKKTKDDIIQSHQTEDRKFRYERIKLNKVPDITFGEKSGEPEDFKAVICNGYHHLLVEKMKQREAIRREKIRQKQERLANRRKVILRVPPERTFEDPYSLWKMKRFANVEAKVSTRRNNDN